MENKSFRIIGITDMDTQGSGYASIGNNLFGRLADMGHDVKVLGLAYNGQEHPYKFSLFPARTLTEVQAMIHNLVQIWHPDVVIVAMDIPYHGGLIDFTRHYELPYIVITPLESDPLCLTWATSLQNANKIYVMSEAATVQFLKRGLMADHLVIGIDTASWRPSTADEKVTIRKSLGIGEDEFVVLTVADNQERKNLSKAFEIMGKFKQEVGGRFRYILVTRPECPVGWKLRELAVDNSINTEYMEFERGVPFNLFWGLYAIADAFLLTSKAEGLGMPILESMAVGVPVVATECGAIIEHLKDGRGYLVHPDYVLLDVWGNSNRYMINVDIATKELKYIKENPKQAKQTVERAREYALARTWDKTVQQLLLGISEVINESQTHQIQQQPPTVIEPTPVNP
jgi:glycosyltransferase involved in cell wall biosynthesis